MRKESGFLIESYHKTPNGETVYLRIFTSGGPRRYGSIYNAEPEWTNESVRALRFGRAEDAASFAELYPNMCCLAKIVEHS